MTQKAKYIWLVPGWEILTCLGNIRIKNESFFPLSRTFMTVWFLDVQLTGSHAENYYFSIAAFDDVVYTS